MQTVTEQDHAAIWAALADLSDPEIPVVSLSELGILRGVRTGADGTPEVVITPTYSGCPAMGQIEDDVRARLCISASRKPMCSECTPSLP